MTQPAPVEAQQTVTMYGPDGAAVEIPAAQAGEAFRSGGYGFAAGQDIPVTDPRSGELTTIKGAQASEFFNSPLALGSRVAGQGEWAGEQERRQYSGVVQGARAFGEGVADGLTFGGATVLATELGGEETRRDMEARARQRANLRLGGEIGGALLPALVTDGASLAAVGGRAATALPRGAAALGGLAERGVVRGAAELGLAESGHAARILSSTARAGTEGAFYGIGSAVSEATLKDEELTAEKLVAAAGHGAFLGGVAGGALTGAGIALRAGANKAGDLAGGLTRRVEEKLAAREATLAAEVEGAVVPRTEVGARSLVARAEEELTLKAAGAQVPEARAFRGLNDGAQKRVVKMFAEDVPEVIGKKQGSLLSVEEKALAAERLVEREGKAIGEVVKQLDAAGAKVEAARITSELSATRETLRGMIDDGKALRAFDKKVALVESKLSSEGESIAALQNAKTQLGREISWKPHHESFSKPLNVAKRDLYFTLDREIERVADKTSQELGEAVTLQWQTAKEGYQAAKWLRDAGNKAADSQSGRRVFGLTEQLGQVAGMMAGGGGPVGVATGLLGAVAHSMVRRYGADVALNLGRAAARGELVRAAERLVDGEVTKSVARYFGRVPSKLPSAAPVAVKLERSVTARRETPSKDYDRRREAVASFLASPDSRAVAATAAIAQTHPSVAAKAQQKAVQAAQFLQDKAPGRPITQTLTPHLDRAEVSPAEKAKWLRYARAVEDPITVLDDMHEGRISREGVEAMKAIYPKLYEQVRGEMAQQLVQQERAIPYSQRVQIGILLDIPADRTMTPEFIAAVQSTFTPTDGGPGAAPQSASKPIRVADQTQTRLAALEGGTEA